MAEIQIEAAALLFDMDGVLISSIASAERCWKLWAKYYDVPRWETFKIPHGVRAIDIVKQTKPDIDPQKGLELIEDMEIEDVGDIHVLEGAGELLAGLPAGRWTIVTSAGSRLMEARVKAAELPLPAQWIAAESVERGKPDPEPYRRGAELLGMTPQDCVVVEDAPSGIEAGLAAGCRVLAVLTSHSELQVREAGATWVVKSLADVELLSSEKELRLQIRS